MSLRVKRSNLVQNHSEKEIATPFGLAMTMANIYGVCNRWNQWQCKLIGDCPNFYVPNS